MVRRSMLGRKASTALRLSILAGVAGWWLIGSCVVWADIYVYRDARGIMHFINVPTKPVYRPFQLLQPYLRSLGGRVSAMESNSPWSKPLSRRNRHSILLLCPGLERVV